MSESKCPVHLTSCLCHTSDTLKHTHEETKASALLFCAILLLWILDLVGMLVAEFSVYTSFAETWGCRFWSIQMCMVAQCGFFLIWTGILINWIYHDRPHKTLLLMFTLLGCFFHLPTGIQTMIDYYVGGGTSPYCAYSSGTIATAFIVVINGIFCIVGFCIVAITIRRYVMVADKDSDYQGDE